MTNFKTCFLCGSPMHLVREKAEMQMGSRSATIDVERMRCDACGEVFYTPEQMDFAQRNLAAELRSQEGLLRPEQIRAIRDKYGLTQVQLEQLLGVGPKTVVRWERGTVFQNRATDELLRMIEAVPAAFDFLARRHDVRISATRVAVAPEVDRPEPTVRFAIPMQKVTKTKGSKVVDMAEYCRSAVPLAEKRVHPEAETGLPTIPQEALK